MCLYICIEIKFVQIIILILILSDARFPKSAIMHFSIDKVCMSRHHYLFMLLDFLPVTAAKISVPALTTLALRTSQMLKRDQSELLQFGVTPEKIAELDEQIKLLQDLQHDKCYKTRLIEDVRLKVLAKSKMLHSVQLLKNILRVQPRRNEFLPLLDTRSLKSEKKMLGVLLGVIQLLKADVELSAHPAVSKCIDDVAANYHEYELLYIKTIDSHAIRRQAVNQRQEFIKSFYSLISSYCELGKAHWRTFNDSRQADYRVKVRKKKKVNVADEVSPAIQAA